MPHLSPIYWVSTFFIFNFILLITVSLLWWHSPVVFGGTGDEILSVVVSSWDWA